MFEPHRARGFFRAALFDCGKEDLLLGMDVSFERGDQIACEAMHSVEILRVESGDQLLPQAADARMLSRHESRDGVGGGLSLFRSHVDPFPSDRCSIAARARNSPKRWSGRVRGTHNETTIAF